MLINWTILGFVRQQIVIMMKFTNESKTCSKLHTVEKHWVIIRIVLKVLFVIAKFLKLQTSFFFNSSPKKEILFAGLFFDY